MSENNKNQNNERDMLVEALKKGKQADMNATSKKIVTEMEGRLQQLIFPFEPWQAPFWIAAMIRIVDSIEQTVPGCPLAARNLMELMKEEQENGED